MKRKPTMYTLALCSLMLASCSDKDIDNGTPLPAGTEIQFGTVLDSNPNSRTYYGDPYQAGGITYWPIYWNDDADKLDKIYIYSPDAAPDRNQATYIVDPEGKDKYQATKVTKDGATGIQTGDAAGDYNFYALYPASAVKGAAADKKIYATFKGQQNPTEIDPPGEVRTLHADMDNCLMTAVNTVASTELSKGVSLQFRPFASVLNIEVNGPTTGATAKITSVLIKSDQQISGDFSVDFSSGQPVFEAKSGTITDADKTIFVSTLTETGEGVSLTNGQKLNIRVFLLPNTDVNTLTVEVSGNVEQSNNEVTTGTWTKNLAMDNFKPSQIHTCILPQLTTEPKEFNKSIWLSQLDPRTYISEISLPGAALSWNSTKYVSGLAQLERTQTLDIPGQFAAGVRVFQAHCWLNSTASPLDQQSPSLRLSATGNETSVSLYDAVMTLTTEMAANHANEFCVLMLSDYSTNSTYTFANLYSRVKDLSDALAARGLLANNIDANTTINDVKGKVILKLQLNSGNTAKPYWGNLNGADALLNTLGTDATNGVWYSQLTFGSSNIADGGKDLSSSLTSWPMSFIYSEQANPVGVTTSGLSITTAVRNALTANVNAFRTNYDPSKHNIFGMSYLGGNGGSFISSFSTTEVTTTLISIWNTATSSGFDSKPYGWVMFNQVGSGNTTINNAIDKVINHNNRSLEKYTGAARHTGNANILNGGQLNN